MVSCEIRVQANWGILVSGHLGEGLLQLLGDRLVLLLLGHQLILQPVHLGNIKDGIIAFKKSGHLLLQFLHGLLSELSAGLGLLQLGAQGLDLLLVGLLPLVGLLLGNLRGVFVLPQVI